MHIYLFVIETKNRKLYKTLELSHKDGDQSHIIDIAYRSISRLDSFLIETIRIN